MSKTSLMLGRDLLGPAAFVESSAERILFRTGAPVKNPSMDTPLHKDIASLE